MAVRLLLLIDRIKYFNAFVLNEHALLVQNTEKLEELKKQLQDLLDRINKKLQKMKEKKQKKIIDPLSNTSTKIEDKAMQTPMNVTKPIEKHDIHIQKDKNLK
jgi:Skp family chaperone for outer membrane proteins